MTSAERFSTLDVLRGTAALGVAYFHFTRGLHTPLGTSGNYGFLGLAMFFVISGFIIPYSMARAGYRIRTHWWSFIARRVVRLDPPYLAAIAVFITLKYLMLQIPGYPGTRPHYGAMQLLLHLGYLNAFFHYEWVDGVYWSLAVEFQYYLLMVLLLPLLVHRDGRVRIASLAAMCATALPVEDKNVVFHYFPLFALGIVAFQYHRELLSRSRFLMLLVPITAMTGITVGVPEMIAGLATAVVIGFANLGLRGPLMLVGTMSYSVYLLHIPIGGRVMNIVSRFPLGPIAAPLGLVCAFTATLAAAAVFHRFVERPAQRWAGALSYGVRVARNRPPLMSAADQQGMSVSR